MTRGTMKLYTSTGTRSIIDLARKHNVGLLMCEHWRDPTKWPYFAIDNGAYSAYARGVEWKPDNFLRILGKVEALGMIPDYVVVPDKVAGGLRSLEFSRPWAAFLMGHFPDFPLYLAVQDGMTPEDLDGEEWMAGLFVGGSMAWKLETMAQWSQYAHRRGIKCHVGRIGPVQRMLLAELAGADSIDSTTWVQRKGVFEKYVNGYRQGVQE